jgi:hypothetical protein
MLFCFDLFFSFDSLLSKMDRDVIFMVAFVLGSSGFSLLLFLWFLCIFFLDEEKKKDMIYRIELFYSKREKKE